MRHTKSPQIGEFRKPKRRAWPLVAAIFLASGCSAFADNVTMQLTGPTSSSAPNLGGVYTDPYTATIGAPGQTTGPITGVSAYVLCDDFSTDVYIGQIWQATSTNVSALNTSTPLALKFDQGNAAAQYSDYMTVAYLATEIMNIDQSTSAGRLQAEQMSFALWGVFDTAPSANNCQTKGGPLSGCWITGTNLTAAENDLSAARTAIQGMNASQFANVYIYTPNPLSASQEYIFVPEPTTWGFLAIGLAAILLAARRARKTGSQPA
jgi:hypothetical protein